MQFENQVLFSWKFLKLLYLSRPLSPSRMLDCSFLDVLSVGDFECMARCLIDLKAVNCPLGCFGHMLLLVMSLRR
jgi:hypothetical protein